MLQLDFSSRQIYPGRKLGSLDPLRLVGVNWARVPNSTLIFTSSRTRGTGLISVEKASVLLGNLITVQVNLCACQLVNYSMSLSVHCSKEIRVIAALGAIFNFVGKRSVELENTPSSPFEFRGYSKLTFLSIGVVCIVSSTFLQFNTLEHFPGAGQVFTVKELRPSGGFTGIQEPDKHS